MRVVGEASASYAQMDAFFGGEWEAPFPAYTSSRDSIHLQIDWSMMTSSTPTSHIRQTSLLDDGRLGGFTSGLFQSVASDENRPWLIMKFGGTSGE
jgi:hypothetical protein